MVVCPAWSLILPPSGKQPAFTWSFSQRERCTLQLGFCDPLAKVGLRLGPRGSARPVEGRGLSPVFSFHSRSDPPSSPELHLGFKGRAGVFFPRKGPWAATGLPPGCLSSLSSGWVGHGPDSCGLSHHACGAAGGWGNLGKPQPGTLSPQRNAGWAGKGLLEALLRQNKAPSSFPIIEKRNRR